MDRIPCIRCLVLGYALTISVSAFGQSPRKENIVPYDPPRKQQICSLENTPSASGFLPQPAIPGVDLPGSEMVSMGAAFTHGTIRTVSRTYSGGVWEANKWTAQVYANGRVTKYASVLLGSGSSSYPTATPHWRSYSYDSSGRLAEETYDQSYRTNYTYNDSGFILASAQYLKDKPNYRCQGPLHSPVLGSDHSPPFSCVSGGSFS
jgi:YD repeat-containing protein